MKPTRYIDKPAYPKGPDGKPLCRGCGGAVPPGRRSWCGKKCVNEYLMRTSSSHLRHQVRARDHGICAACGLDCELLKDRWNGLRLGALSYQHRIDAVAELARQHPGLTRASYWQADHIVEVVNGGGSCGLDNLQTLCRPCHNRKTAALARQRAELRRGAPELTFSNDRKTTE